MKIKKDIGDLLTYIQHRCKESTVDDIIWWLNLTPQWAGFSILTHKNSVLFWTIQFTLLFYMDFISNFVYRIILSEDINGVIKANTNLSIIIFTINSDVWFFTKRTLLISTILKVKEIDKLSSKSFCSINKHKQLLKRIKLFVIIYIFVNFVNVLMVWLPQRMDLSSAFHTSHPCPGLNITNEINKHICRAIIFVQDTTISVVVINYQSLLLFFIAHTAGMYRLMSEEMLALNEFEDIDRGEIKERLNFLIERHAMLLDMVQRLRSLYITAIGIDLGDNAYSICLFFTLSLHEWINFAPLLSYCFVVFFLYCFLWQKLIDASIAFERSVYACGWEKFEVSEKKSVHIVLQLAQKPVLLLAGGVIPIDINTFANAMKFIYKFVTALKC